MRKFITIALLFPALSFAQTIKVSNGFNYGNYYLVYEKTFANNVEGSRNRGISYIGSIGVDYLDKKWFYLSSEIGFYSARWKTANRVISLRDNIKDVYGFDATTTFRVKLEKTNFHVYLGSGLNFKFGLKEKQIIYRIIVDPGVEPYESSKNGNYKIEQNNFVFCPSVRFETGFNYYTQHRILIGFNFSCDIPLLITSKTPPEKERDFIISQSEAYNMLNNCIPLGFKVCLGYKF
jgi:hypothetical protein